MSNGLKLPFGQTNKKGSDIQPSIIHHPTEPQTVFSSGEIERRELFYSHPDVALIASNQMEAQ